jgi:hypothetical protein
MGCDIHLKLQRFINNNWETIPLPERDWNVPYEERAPDPRSRNYNVFAFLADVRNGYGFAGVETHKEITPQFPHRGLPDGIDPNPFSDNEDESYNNWLGDHSFTWATIAELKAAPWNAEFHAHGVISELEFKSRRAANITNEPDGGWAGAVLGKGLVTIDENDYDQTRHTIHAAVPEDKCYVRAHWTWQPLIDCQFKRWLDTLTEHTLGVPLTEARLIMGFDN